VDAEQLELAQDRYGAGEVVDQNAFGDLELEPVGFQAPHFEARLRKTRRSLYGVANANNLIIRFSIRFRRVICDPKEFIG
jgi:hypothetical protein